MNDFVKPYNPRDYQAPGGGVYLTNIANTTPEDKERVSRIRAKFAETGIDAEIFNTPMPGYNYSQGHRHSLLHVPYGYAQALKDGLYSVVSYEDDHAKVWSVLHSQWHNLMPLTAEFGD